MLSATSQGRTPVQRHDNEVFAFLTFSHPRCAPRAAKHTHTPLRGAVGSWRIGVSLFCTLRQTSWLIVTPWCPFVSHLKTASPFTMILSLKLSCFFIALSFSPGFFWRMQTFCNRVHASGSLLQEARCNVTGDLVLIPRVEPGVEGTSKSLSSEYFLCHIVCITTVLSKLATLTLDSLLNQSALLSYFFMRLSPPLTRKKKRKL